MHLDFSFKRFSIISGYAALIALFVVSCGTAPPREDGSADDTTELTFENINTVLEAANLQPPFERTAKYLDVVQMLLDAGELDWARSTLSQVSPATVPREHTVRYAILNAAIAMQQGQPYVAKRYLWDSTVESAAAQSSSLEQQVNFHHVRAQLLYSIAEYRASIEERLFISSIVRETEKSEHNQDLLWQTLMELPYKDLMLESQLQNSRVARGWYNLAALSKNNQTNIRKQLEEVEGWALNWPDHPASLRLPADLQLLKQLAEEQPQHIALLLPMSGKLEPAAKAILDGFMAAYYHAREQGDQVAELRFYDTAIGDINTVYDTAVASGAELIVGPLEQEKIAELALRPELPVPTLALNRLTGPLDEAIKLFQFGLPLEDEAEQVAQKAWQDGHRRAMILAPASSNGDRSVVSFSEKWKALGGEIINDYRYKDQSSYSDLVKHAVNIKESEERRHDIRYLMGRPIEFEPRRRKDIDFIFMYANASQARQLKPILKFHYAGDVPVYAIKDVYNGRQDPERNNDLNNIRFTTIPWYFEAELPEKLKIADYSNSVNFQTLYALGVDAYHIHPRLRQLESIKKAHFYGATGALSLDEKRKITREQIWAKFNKGYAFPTAAIDQQEDDAS